MLVYFSTGTMGKNAIRLYFIYALKNLVAVLLLKGTQCFILNFNCFVCWEEEMRIAKYGNETQLEAKGQYLQIFFYVTTENVVEVVLYKKGVCIITRLFLFSF